MTDRACLPLTRQRLRLSLALLVLGFALLSLGCMTSTIITEVTRNEQGQHLVGQSLTIEFNKALWNELDAEDRKGVSEFTDGFKRQGWSVQTSEEGRVINATKPAVAIEALAQQGWSVSEQKLETGRIVTATLARFNPFDPSSSSGTGEEFMRDIVLLLDESNPDSARYKYQATVLIEDTSSPPESGSPPPTGEGGPWTDAINEAIESSPELKRLEEAMKNAGPPKITVGIAFPGSIQSATINGAPGGEVFANTAQWPIVLDKAGTYKLEAVAQQDPDVELQVMVSNLEGLQNGVLLYGDTATVSASVSAKNWKTKEEVKDIHPVGVKLYYDDAVVAQGQTDSEGHVSLTFSAPESTPDGLSTHQYKLEASKKGLRTGEDKRDIKVSRGLGKIVVTANAVPGVHQGGTVITISGRVMTAAEPGKESAPVEGVVEASDDSGGSQLAATDAEGRFSMAFFVPAMDRSRVDNKMTVRIVATPKDTEKLAAGETAVEVSTSHKGSLKLTAGLDKAVYNADETVTLSGMVTSDGKPMEATVDIVLNGNWLGSVRSGPDGRYVHTFQPSSAPLVPGIGQLPPVYANIPTDPNPPTSTTQLGDPVLAPAMHVVKVLANEPGYDTDSNGSDAYFRVSSESDECRAENIWVSGVVGNPSAYMTTQQAEANLGVDGHATFLQLGASIPQGLQVSTDIADRVTLTFPLSGNDRGSIALGNDTMVEIVQFCRDATGKLHIGLRVLKSGKLMVNWPTGANVDFKIVTPSAEVSNVHTHYMVTVDEAGSTSVATLEGRVRLTDKSGASIDVEAGKQVTVRVGDTFGNISPVDIQAEVEPELTAMLKQAELSFVPPQSASANPQGGTAPGSSDLGTFLPWIIAAGVGVLLLAVLLVFGITRSRSRPAPALLAPPPPYTGVSYPPAPNYQQLPANPFTDRLRWVEAEYSRLRNQATLGQITPEQIADTLRNNPVRDANGYVWALGVDGRWYVFDGQSWVEGNPYSVR